jgi:plasmid stabilization system protein ParE
MQELSDVVDYFMEVAGKRSATRITAKIIAASAHLASHPEMGPVECRLEGLPYTYRSVVADKNYKIIYRIDAGIVHIFSIWDCRQAPETLKERVKKL